MKKHVVSAALLLALSHASLAAQVGLTEGAFKVNELGQATYTIPIKLPAGGELVPSISLNYRSIESEGIAGVGWTLAGTSAIDRCPKVAAISGTSSGVTLTSSDYLCLDGQRLRTISGTYGATNSTYGTHLDSGAVVTALGSVGTGPAAFSVKQLDGSTWYYGDLSATSLSLKNSTGSATATADATIAAGSVTGTWLLKAIVDGSGNYIVYEYDSGGIGEKVLTSIHYTGHTGASHPKSKATFTYSARSHATSARYRFGTIAQETRLLSGISVFQGSDAYRHYALSYDMPDRAGEHHYLRSVKECTDSTQGNCLPPTTLTWERPNQEGTAELVCIGDTAGTSSCTSTELGSYVKPISPKQDMLFDGSGVTGARLMDMDGDGRDDMVYVRSNMWRARLAPLFSTEYALSSIGYDKPELALSADLDGDGALELIVASNDSSYWTSLAFAPGNSIGARLVCGPEPGAPYLCREVSVVLDAAARNLGIVAVDRASTIVADTDGDGKQDLVYFKDGNFYRYKNFGWDGISTISFVKYTMSAPENLAGAMIAAPRGVGVQSLRTADMNGDGKGDLVFKFRSSKWVCKGQCPTPKSFSEPLSAAGNTDALSAGDDSTAGEPDLGELDPADLVEELNEPESWTVEATTDVAAGAPELILTDADELDTAGAAETPGLTLAGSQGPARGDLMMNINGLALETTYSLKVYLADGNTLTAFNTTNSDIDNLRIVDFNADGLSDLAYTFDGVWQIKMSMGNAMDFTRSTGLSSANPNQTQFVDVSLDGATDILHAKSNGALDVRIAVPMVGYSGVSSRVLMDFVDQGDIALGTDAVVLPGDINQDGRPDLMTITSAGDGWRLMPSTRGYRVPHALSAITNGHGIPTEIAYRPAQDAGVRIGSSNNTVRHSMINLNRGLFVVSTARSLMSGIPASGGWARVYYDYGGLLVSLRGYGLIGFEVVRSTDGLTGVVTETQYKQAFPYFGLPAVTRSVKDGKELFFARNSYSYKFTPRNGYLAYAELMEEWQNDIGSDGAIHPMLKTSVSQTRDNYGNVVTSTVRTESLVNSSSDYEEVATTNVIGDAARGQISSSTTTRSNPQRSVTNTATYTYYPSGLVQSTTRNAGTANELVTTHLYDIDGSIKTVRKRGRLDPDSTTTTTRSARRTQLTNAFLHSATNELGLVETFGYDGLSASAHGVGRVGTLTITDSNGLVRTKTYDAFGGLSTETNAQGVKTYYSATYCSETSCQDTDALYMMRVRQDGRPETRTYYDAWGRELSEWTQTSGSDWSVTAVRYDSYGRVNGTRAPALNAKTGPLTSFTFDGLGRLAGKQMPSGGKEAYRFYGLTSEVETMLMKHRRRLGANGEVRSLTDGSGAHYVLRYDPTGGLASSSMTTSAGSVVLLTRQYDELGRMTRETSASTNSSQYRYNAFDELISRTNARNQTTRMGYNAMGALISVSSPEGLTCQDYGTTAHAGTKAAGKLRSVKHWSSAQPGCTTAATPYYTESYEYDSVGRGNKTTITVGSESFVKRQSYDSLGRIASKTFPGSYGVAATYSYSNGHLTGISVGGTSVMNGSSMDAFGNLRTVTYGNGVVDTRTFNSHTGRLVTSSWAKSGTALGTLNYTYDSGYRVKSRQVNMPGSATYGGTSHNHNETYGFDANNRLASRTVSVTTAGSLPADFRASNSYSYTPFGQLSAMPGVGSYTYDLSNPVRLKTAGGRTLSYDADGNVTHDGVNRSWYTSFNKPYQIEGNGVEVSYTYGPGQQLITESYYSPSDNSWMALHLGDTERRSRGGVTEWRFQVSPTITVIKRSNGAHDVHYRQTGADGSTFQVAGSTGNVLERLAHNAWGKSALTFSRSEFSNGTYQSPAVDGGMQGHNIIEGTEIVHMGGRTYNATLGRMMQADPLTDGALGASERYGAFRNNPVNSIDPTGYSFLGLDLSNPFSIRTSAFFGAPEAFAIHAMTGEKVLQKYEWARTLQSAAAGIVSVYFGPWVAAANSAYLTELMGGSNRDSLRAFAVTYAAAYASGAINDVTGGQLTWSGVLMSSAVGGLAAEVSGGKFGHGFVAGGLTYVGGHVTNNLSVGQNDGSTFNQALRVANAAMIGGTASYLLGGKFANGAATAAFMRTYSEAFMADTAPRHEVKKLGNLKDLSQEDMAKLALEMGWDGSSEIAFVVDSPFKTNGIWIRFSADGGVVPNAFHEGVVFYDDGAWYFRHTNSDGTGAFQFGQTKAVSGMSDAGQFVGDKYNFSLFANPDSVTALPNGLAIQQAAFNSGQWSAANYSGTLHNCQHGAKHFLGQ